MDGVGVGSRGKARRVYGVESGVCSSREEDGECYPLSDAFC